MNEGSETETIAQPAAHSHVTLAGCMLLHAFTHAYGTMLVPLYLLMQKDLGTRGVKPVAFIVTAYGVVYALFSYPSGILADRLNRKTLLGMGLIGNAVAIGLMGFVHNYWGLLGLGVMAGLFGTLFHPSANALASAHYPRNPGLAIGLMGVGSGLGFFAGPQFAGWRAAHNSGGYIPAMSSWQIPCFELGLVGVAAGLLFVIWAREVAHGHGSRPRTPLGPGMRRRITAIALVLGCRDFAGVATMTLVSLYLQRAHGYDTLRTGWIVGAMMLISMVANPVAVLVSGGRRRLPALTALLVIGGIVLTTIPRIPVVWILPALAFFQIFHLGSYAIGETALLERVVPAVRGRVIGLFLTCAGTFASTSPWVMGWWTDALGERARTTPAYYLPFGVLGGMMVFAALSARLIAALARPVEELGYEPVKVLAPNIEPIG